MSLSAWVIPPRPPAELLVQLVVTDLDQNERAIASRPLPYGSARNPALWDHTLTELGFTRVSPWREADEGRSHVCEVKRV